MNKWSTVVILACTLLAGQTLFAQQNHRFGNRTPQKMNAETAKQWVKLQAELKQKYPKKYAKIETLAKTNLAQAMQEMNALAREANMDLPRNNNRRDRFQEGPRGEFFGGMRGNRPDFGNRRPGGMFTNVRAETEKQLKEKYPAEYAKIETLRNSAETQLQDLAKKAGVTLPDTPETMQKKIAAVREKYKNEFAEIEKLRETDPQMARERTTEIFQREGIQFFGGMNRNFQQPSMQEPPPPAHRANSMMGKMTLIQQAYPEEMKKLRALRSEDPAAYRKGLMELVARYDKDHAKENSKK